MLHGALQIHGLPRSRAPMDHTPVTNTQALPSTHLHLHSTGLRACLRGVVMRRVNVAVAMWCRHRVVTSRWPAHSPAASRHTPAVPFLPFGWRPLWICFSPGDTWQLPNNKALLFSSPNTRAELGSSGWGGVLIPGDLTIGPEQGWPEPRVL